LIVSDASVRAPLLRSYDATVPSTKFEGFAVEIKRARAPVVYARPICVKKFSVPVVNGFDVMDVPA